ncbi:MAG: hypothetical protein II122_03580 [Bacteroidaceae bacterium]|nr:hypothetical protein [Bacteroidaceae bacterium]
MPFLLLLSGKAGTRCLLCVDVLPGFPRRAFRSKGWNVSSIGRNICSIPWNRETCEASLTPVRRRRRETPHLEWYTRNNGHAVRNRRDWGIFHRIHD